MWRASKSALAWHRCCQILKTTQALFTAVVSARAWAKVRTNVGGPATNRSARHPDIPPLGLAYCANPRSRTREAGPHRDTSRWKWG